VELHGIVTGRLTGACFPFPQSRISNRSASELEEASRPDAVMPFRQTGS